MRFRHNSSLRQLQRLAWASLLGFATSVGAEPFASRVEILEWSSPERALQLLDSEPLAAQSQAAEIPLLEVRGMVYADLERTAAVLATGARLAELGSAGNPAAIAAEHYVRAYDLVQAGRHAAADAELSQIDLDAITDPAARYRIVLLKGL